MVDVIDKLQPSLYERVGKELIVALSHAFYTRVFADEDEEFRSMFNHVTIEEADTAVVRMQRELAALKLPVREVVTASATFTALGWVYAVGENLFLPGGQSDW